MIQNRKACRAGQRCEPKTLAEALYCCGHHSGVDIDAIAEALGVRPGYLYDALNPDREEVQFQARLMLPLMRITDNDAPLRFLCRERDGAFMPLPSPGPDAVENIRKKFLQVVKEVGEDAKVVDQALADERISEREQRRVVDELDRTIETILAVRACFELHVQTVPEKGKRAGRLF